MAALFLTMKKTILTLLILLFPHPVLAYTELVDLFIDKGTASLMHGGLKRLLKEQDSLDFTAPLFLDSKGKYRIDTGYEYQRTARVFTGRWSGSHAYEERLESAAAAPFTLFDNNVIGSVAVGYGSRWSDVNSDNREEDILVKSSENFEAKKGGLYLNAWNRLKIGTSLISTDYRGRLEVPIEAEVTPSEFVKIGYKRSYIDVAANLAVSLSGKSGLIPLRYGEELNELYVIGNYKGIIYGKYANELGKTGNRRFEGKLSLPWSLYLVGDYQQRDFNFYQGFSVEGKDGGYLQGDFAFREYRAGIGVDPAEKWNLELNYRHWELTSSGGGIANSAAVVDFWPSLIVGNYNHTYDMALSADQYHAAMEYKGDSLNFGLGAQYIYLKTAAKLDYWRSLLFGLGRAGANTVELSTDRVKLLFISLGLGYRWENVSITYTFGQFVPLGTHDNKVAAETTAGGGGGANIWDSITDKIDRNPGGNIQRVLLSVMF
jgi:hypothetical protein